MRKFMSRALFDAIENQMADLTESPIETRFLAHFIAEIELMVYGPHHCLCKSFPGQWGKFDDQTPAIGIVPDKAIFIFPQARIEEYRADFVIGYAISHQGFVKKLPLVVVECDGHDYHERTKEQAQHDKERDRRFNALGFRVLRFTGSEIFRDGHQCAGEVLDFLTQLKDEYVGKSSKPMPVHVDGLVPASGPASG